ncbi:SDR family NAD(P)-dependent oxidoreductase [Jiulongibacter sp. NS-SX5]|uniref:SDR family NAD(P)-dependent oxidoreductase n=1 Tax=Jiulongibacter sp. NS-SX5 TaxID=3463854 RepID=UPI00405A46AF
MKIEGKVIVVTGAGSGMGRELSLLLLSRGASVAGIDLKLDSLEETKALASEAGSKFLAVELNITDKEKVAQLPVMVKSHFGAVDGLINNAGIIQPFVAVNDLTDDLVKRVMDVNFYGTYYMTKAFLPEFLNRPEAHIVNISSMGGFIPFPKQTIYGASKAAVKIFTEGLYAELRNTNVNVTVVHPGAVNTNITQNSGLKLERPTNDKANKLAMPAPKAAEVILKGMERNKYRVKVGKDAALLDFLYRLYPAFATRFIGKMMEKNLPDM